jgi:UPF0755 protein
MRDFSSRQMNSFEPKQKRFSLLKCCSLLVLIILIAGGTFGYLQFYSYKSFTDGFAQAKKVGSFEVKEGETVDSIMGRLVEEGYLENNKVLVYPAYKVYLKFNAVDSTSIQAGIYEVNSADSPEKILSNFRAKGCTEVKVTLKEGLRVEEMAEELEKKFAVDGSVFKKDNYIKLARNFDSTGMNFGFTLPKNLEGYLFPDTYRFCNDVKTEDIIKTQLDTFNKKVYQIVKNTIPKDHILEKFDDIINLASIVQREGRNPNEWANIADIFLKRLNDGMTLGSDTTTQYEVGYSQKSKTWWVSGAELDEAVHQPGKYNTRLNAWLPPTPIASPGLEAIKAVINPIHNNYYFFLVGNDEKMYYAKNLNDHNVNKAIHLR